MPGSGLYRTGKAHYEQSRILDGQKYMHLQDLLHHPRRKDLTAGVEHLGLSATVILLNCQLGKLTEWDVGDNIVGAAALHVQLKHWLNQYSTLSFTSQ